MNEKNYDYLCNQLKYAGFGEDLKEVLKDQMQKGEAQFTLGFQKNYGQDETTAVLHFRKSDESDMYFFNRYSMMLKNERNIDPIKQNFYINHKEDSITLKEAYNLLSGRSVHKELANKEGEKYKAWLQIDFKETDTSGNYKLKQYHQNYGYDLKMVLNSYPVKELSDDQLSQRLVESLERGNRQSITMDLGGKEVKIFIEANPQFKTLNLFDAGMKRVSRQSLSEKTGQQNSQGQEMKASQKSSAGDEDAGASEAQKKPKRKKQKVS